MRLFWDWFNGDASTSGDFTFRHAIRNPVIFRSVGKGHSVTQSYLCEGQLS